MAVERAAGGSSLIDVLDRVLDKGIVIDAWVRVSLVGIASLPRSPGSSRHSKYERIGGGRPVRAGRGHACESHPMTTAARTGRARGIERGQRSADGSGRRRRGVAFMRKKTAKTKERRPRSGPRARRSGARAPRERPRLTDQTGARGGRAVRGKYVYGHRRRIREIRRAGIGDNGTEIHTVHYRDLAAVVSDVPLGVLDSTRENVLAHERVNEIVMRDHTVIPMSFGTIFKTRDDIVQLLRSAYDAFGDVLSKMRDKMEFGLKVLWDRDSIVKDSEDEMKGSTGENEIALQKGSTYFARMQYGRARSTRPSSRGPSATAARYWTASEMSRWRRASTSRSATR